MKKEELETIIALLKAEHETPIEFQTAATYARAGWAIKRLERHLSELESDLIGNEVP